MSVDLKTLQRIAFWVAIVCATLGFLTSAGCQFGPAIPAGATGLLHGLLVFLGAACGYFAVLRGDEIDRERWQIAEDPALTSGERDYAHKNAERRRRAASTSFLAAPLMLGYWLAYQIEGEGTRLAAQLLPVTGILGAIAGWIVARLRSRGS